MGGLRRQRHAYRHRLGGLDRAHLECGRLRHAPRPARPPRRPARRDVSPDGKRVVTASRDKTARIWNADGSGVPILLHGHPDQVRFAAFSPDGTRVATSSLDELRIWNADGSGEPLVILGDAMLGKFAFSPDGSRIVAGMADGTLRIFGDLQPIEPSDPRLWAATSYCLPVAMRQDLLGVTAPQAQADLAACERHVRAARASH